MSDKKKEIENPWTAVELPKENKNEIDGLDLRNTEPEQNEKQSATPAKEEVEQVEVEPVEVVREETTKKEPGCLAILFYIIVTGLIIWAVIAFFVVLWFPILIILAILALLRIIFS